MLAKLASVATCQLRPTADLSFFQLFLPQTLSAHAGATIATQIGNERYLVSLFVDMRGSTQLAEKRLPFDTVFIVNRFLGAVSQAVIEAGGRPNQFVGDGMLALFGLTSGKRDACRQALRAAALIASKIGELNEFLSHDLREPIRFGIGIHGGEVIVGGEQQQGLARTVVAVFQGIFGFLRDCVELGVAPSVLLFGLSCVPRCVAFHSLHRCPY